MSSIKLTGVALLLLMFFGACNINRYEKVLADACRCLPGELRNKFNALGREAMEGTLDNTKIERNIEQLSEAEKNHIRGCIESMDNQIGAADNQQDRELFKKAVINTCPAILVLDTKYL